MEKKTGQPAYTIHRWLGLVPGQSPTLNVGNQTMSRLVIVDESTMIDSVLMGQLIDAIGPDTKVIFVGDGNQLPPVGPGCPFIDMTGIVPFVNLQQVMRQVEGSNILHLAYSILAGNPSIKTGGDVTICPSKNVIDEAANWWLAKGTMDRVVLSAFKSEKVDVATTYINSRIRELQPAGSQIGRSQFRVGDYVICCENNYIIGVFNGQIFKIEEANGRKFRIDDMWMEYGSLSLFQPAPALTVHKSQGGEFPEVMLVLDKRYAVSMNLLYTAVTRAKSHLYLCGDLAPLLKRRASDTSTRMTAFNRMLIDNDLYERVLNTYNLSDKIEALLTP